MSPRFNLGNGQQLFMQGMDGVPFRGYNLPFLKKEESQRLIDVLDAKVKVFNLSNKEDLAEYQRIWDCAAKGWYVVCAEERNFVAEERAYYIFIRYAEMYKEQPGELTSRVTYNGNGISVK